MKEELLLLIPRMVDVDEHINAADELLKCLTAAPDARFVLGQQLKLPAIVALSTLHPLFESTGDRQRVLSAMLAVCLIPFQLSLWSDKTPACSDSCVSLY